MLSFVHTLTMAIDVDHQLNIHYLLRNGARAIRVPIYENKGKMHENKQFMIFTMLIHSI
jgi:hypothetical protein